MSTSGSSNSNLCSPRSLLKSFKTIKIKRTKSEFNISTKSKLLPIGKPTSHHTLRVARRYDHLDPNLEPLPGSLAHDLMLEKLDKAEEFFGENVKLPSPLYDENGKVIPWRIVGQPEHFERMYKEKMKDKLKSDIKAVKNSVVSSEVRISNGLSVRKIVKKKAEEPETAFSSKLAEIQARKIKAHQESIKNLENHTIEGKILIQRQTKALESYHKIHQCWNSIETNLSNRLRTAPENLALNRGNIYREKIEEYNFIDRAGTAEERTGKYGWYMSLRSTESSMTGSFIPIGNTRNGLFTKLSPKSAEPETVIRRPGTVPSTQWNFKQNPYFQQKMNQRTGRRVKLSSVAQFDDLIVSGEEKLGLEVNAVHHSGVKKLNLNLLDECIVEEVISANYEPRYYGMIA